ncbi:hypothetical protein [Enterocloster sp.]|uniref:hypothetical protein n=1 Tax=Enterocloster sp. TaxID=2719315 RepID=UPI0039A3314C
MAYAADKITVNGIQLGQLEKWILSVKRRTWQIDPLWILSGRAGAETLWYYRRGKHIHLCGADVDFFGNHNKAKIYGVAETIKIEVEPKQKHPDGSQEKVTFISGYFHDVQSAGEIYYGRIP